VAIRAEKKKRLKRHAAVQTVRRWQANAARKKSPEQSISSMKAKDERNNVRTLGDIGRKRREQPLWEGRGYGKRCMDNPEA